MRKTLTAEQRARLTLWIHECSEGFWVGLSSKQIAAQAKTNLDIDITPDMARAALLAVYPELKKQPTNTKSKELEREIAELRARLDKLTQMATGKLL